MEKKILISVKWLVGLCVVTAVVSAGTIYVMVDTIRSALEDDDIKRNFASNTNTTPPSVVCPNISDTVTNQTVPTTITILTTTTTAPTTTTTPTTTTPTTTTRATTTTTEPPPAPRFCGCKCIETGISAYVIEISEYTMMDSHAFCVKHYKGNLAMLSSFEMAIVSPVLSTLSAASADSVANNMWTGGRTNSAIGTHLSFYSPVSGSNCVQIVKVASDYKLYSKDCNDVAAHLCVL